MKKLLLYCLTVLFLISCFITAPQSFAQSHPTLSLSDAVLADLAIHDYLDYISVDFKDFRSKNTVAINETRQWLPASTVKLYVAMYAYDQIARNTISLDNWVTIDDKNVVPTELETNEYPVLTAGLTTTIDTLIKKMITQSDNTAYNTLLDVLDRQKITAFVQSLGLSHTIIGSKLNLDDDQTQYEYTTPGYNINTTTAADYESAYEMIDENKIKDSKLLFDILKQQKIQNMIPAYLPNTVTIAHKTGDLDPLYHDGGIIVDKNKHYALTIFSNLGNPHVLSHISQLIYTQNFALVGQQVPDSNDNTIPQLQALDDLVLHPGKIAVLGIQTPVIHLPLPEITAADLGIHEKELSLIIPKDQLPHLFIDPSGPFEKIIPLFFDVENAVVIGEKARQEVAINFARYQLAEVENLFANGKFTDGENRLQSIQQILTNVAKDKVLTPDAQTQISMKAVSDTRFALMRDHLNHATGDTRIALIQEIATQAKQTLTTINPAIPQAKALTSPEHKPILGDIVASTNDNLTVQTPSGEQISVPITSSTLIKDAQHPPLHKPNNFKIGSTVALIGDLKGNVLTASFILTNVPNELAAPQPVTVAKVDTKNKTMVVVENGTPIQIDLTNQTTIKAKDTDIPLKAIRQGDVVVVHGEKIEQVSDQPQIFIAPTPTPQVVKEGKKGKDGETSVTASPPSSSNSSPTTVHSQGVPGSSNTQPVVIQATSVQVVTQQNTSSPTTTTSTINTTSSTPTTTTSTTTSKSSKDTTDEDKKNK